MLNLSKFKTLAENNLKNAKMVISACDRVENTVGKGWITNTFFPFPSIFFFF